MEAEVLHMSLRDRKTYALLSSYLQAVRAAAPGANPADLVVVSEAVASLVSDAAIESVNFEPQPALDLFLTDAAEKVENLVRTRLGSRYLSETARNVLDAMRGTIGGILCATCSPERICNGLDSDSAIVAAETGGHCIRSIKDAISKACHITDCEYSKYLGGAAPPQTVFRTTALRNAAGLIPLPGLAINGTTHYIDRPYNKVSVIDVRVAPTAMTKLSLAALDYMVLHEVFCHAYQMMASDGPRRNRGSTPDPISEGMADAVALKLLKRNARRSEDSICTANFKAARIVHEARGCLDFEPTFPEAPWVSQGIAAANAVQRFYSQGGPSRLAIEDTIALTVSLNVAKWDFSSRYNGLTNLLKGLGMKPKDTELMWQLLKFRSTRDSSELIRHLTMN